MTDPKHLALAAALALALAATAVGGDGKIVKVEQKDKQFTQTEIRVRRGDTVTFANSDTVMHNVYSISPGNQFEIKTQLPGKESDVQFKNAGVAEVRCAIHPNMKLKVNVDP